MRTLNEALKYARKKCKTSNPLELAKALNIIIVHIALVEIRGFYQYYKRNHIIYLDENLNETEQTFVLDHEIGHMLMHSDQNAIYLDSRTFYEVSKYERQANTFAIELLMPDSLLKEYEGYSIYALASMVGIPMELVGLKRM